MRGKLGEPEKFLYMLRITPAYAGKTPAPQRAHRPGKDHPRVCGENAISYPSCLRQAGSPPRMRGKRLPVSRFVVAARITPAYAGKTPPPCLFAGARQDHPRVCGENFSRPTSCPFQKGSPPRMRGKPFPNGTASRESRITPAYAGKTLRPALASSIVQDHPRVCGENFGNPEVF